MKKLVPYIVFPLLILSILFLYGFSFDRNQQNEIEKIAVKFYGGDNSFLTHESVNKLLIQNGASIKNQPKSVIDLHVLENKVITNPYVEKATVSLTVEGELKAKVKQREPLARIVIGRDSYYVDKYGVKMPLSAKHSARVPFVFGLDTFDDVKEITQLVTLFSEDSFLKKEIISITKSNDEAYVFNVRSGDYTINFGKFVRVDKKIKKLKAFYNKALLDKTIHNYKIINLKYRNQVVCTKQDQDGKQ